MAVDARATNGSDLVYMIDDFDNGKDEGVEVEYSRLLFGNACVCGVWNENMDKQDDAAVYILCVRKSSSVDQRQASHVRH